MRSLLIFMLGFLLIWLVAGTDILEARGSFGGFRGGGGRSFGGSRSFGKSFSAPKRSFTPPPTKSVQPPRSSFGGKAPATNMGRAATSFGGTRMASSGQYTAKYGVPRRTITSGQMAGIPNNYVVHDYGGFGSGLMMGYMMGHTSWMWSMPFHPAFYYSRPYYVENPDGTMSVYPPTFSWSKLFFTAFIFLAIIYIIYVIVRNRRRGAGYGRSQSSFS